MTGIRGLLRLSALAPVLLLTPGMAGAQHGCFRGRPQPTCSSFWLTEAEFGLALAGRNGLSGDDLRAGAEVGWMHAIGQRSALGGGVAIGWDLSEYVSLRPRYRRWLSPSWALDLSPGVRWTPGRIENVEGRVAVHWRDLAGLWTEVDLDLAGSAGTRWFAGVQTGGQAGLVSYAVGALTFLFYAIRFASQAN